MARLVRHTQLRPIKIEPQDKPIFVCACGLSKTFPICDGSHKGCVEQEGRLYTYGPGGEIVDDKPDIG